MGPKTPSLATLRMRIENAKQDVDMSDDDFATLLRKTTGKRSIQRLNREDLWKVLLNTKFGFRFKHGEEN